MNLPIPAPYISRSLMTSVILVSLSTLSVTVHGVEFVIQFEAVIVEGKGQ